MIFQADNKKVFASDSGQGIDKNKETKLCAVLKKSHKMGMLNCLDLASYDQIHFKNIVKSAAKYCDYLLLNELEAELATGIKIVIKNKFVKS